MHRNMSRFGALFLLLLLALAISLPGCADPPGEPFSLPAEPPLPPEPGDGYLGTLYYPDKELRFLVPVQRAIPETETVVRNTLEKLVETPQLKKELEPLGLVPLLPEKTAILGIHIGETGPARVDFSSPFLQYESSAERLVLGGLLCTLRQFPQVEQLKIMVEGDSPEKFPGGTPGAIPLGPECLLNLEVDDALNDYHNYTAVTIYFCLPTPQGRILYVPVTRVLQPVKEHHVAALKELLDGPRQGSGLFSDIPPGTELLSLHLEEDLAIIDLSAELLTYEGGRTGAENMLNQILLTLVQLEGVGKVQLLVEGEKITLPDGLDLSNPLESPATCNYF